MSNASVNLNYHGIARVELTTPKAYTHGPDGFKATNVILYDETGEIVQVIGVFSGRGDSAALTVQVSATAY